MKVVRLEINNFRCIRHAVLFPGDANVYLGQNNVGKTAILEALNLLLNPETSARNAAIDENDFYNRIYLASATDQEAENGSPTDTPDPVIRIEAVLTDLDDKDHDLFLEHILPWDDTHKAVIETAPEGSDPFDGRQPAIRVAFEGWYSHEEDDFQWSTFFQDVPDAPRDNCKPFTREHKRRIGFLIYRDLRALQRPITLEPSGLFNRLLQSRDLTPKHFEEIFSALDGVLSPLFRESDFAALINAYKSELERFLPLNLGVNSTLGFKITDFTRSQLKPTAQLYFSSGDTRLPIQNAGAGTRSLAILAMLTLIMRQRNRGILALEEPETFLFPHAQRRVIDECMSLARQIYVTTHSPYVLERFPPAAVVRVSRTSGGELSCSSLPAYDNKTGKLYFRRLREGVAEALLGHGVLVTEGESDRLWLLGISRIAGGQEACGVVVQALELLGITVISAGSNGEIPGLCEFLAEAGLITVAVYDATKDASLAETIVRGHYSSIALRHRGLEAILSNQLPEGLLREFLVSCPFLPGETVSETEMDTWSAEEVRDRAFHVLKKHKGTKLLHEWLLGRLGADSVPPTLLEVVLHATDWVTNGVRVSHCTLLQ